MIKNLNSDNNNNENNDNNINGNIKVVAIIISVMIEEIERRAWCKSLGS